ncbi:hypothetical protein LIER_14069 [Lithospermum erythrorhizon]|uniref:Uncharacterized protein n=1 Tax=Lithospermum erythrorhizon TaxID=34254 RepID=A0AAV3PZB8_LITER
MMTAYSPIVVTEQASPVHARNGSVGPVIGVLVVIAVLGAVAVVIGRLCSGRKIMDHGQYDFESWVEIKCASCIDGHVNIHPPAPPPPPVRVVVEESSTTTTRSDSEEGQAMAADVEEHAPPHDERREEEMMTNNQEQENNQQRSSDAQLFSKPKKINQQHSRNTQLLSESKENQQQQHHEGAAGVH